MGGLRRVFIGVLVVVLIFTLISPVLYQVFIKPSRPLNIAIVDKTVTVFDAEARTYPEHYSMFWILNHEKIYPTRSGSHAPDRNSNGRYDIDHDYFGYYPPTDKLTGVLDIDLRSIDLLYLADAYGLLEYLPNGTVRRRAGGYSVEEANAIAEYARSGGSIIAEWNTVGYPTYLNRTALDILESVFHVRTYGYGKYYPDLANVEKYYKEMYREVTGQEWRFTGEGIMIIQEFVVGSYPKQEKVEFIILEKTDLQTGVFPMFLHVRNDHPAFEGADSLMPYAYWFEIAIPTPDVKVLGEYEIKTTNSGREKLARHGLKPMMTAIITYEGSYRHIYYAGDFADYAPNYPPFLLSYIAGIGSVMRLLPTLPWDGFFWRFYYPTFMKSVKWVMERGT